jgi:iron complex transport system substrate-binding protein
MRVVSLLPSATEIVAALGGFEHVVGLTHCCDYPPQVESRLRVTRTSVDADASPGAVDAQVRAIAHEGAPLYTLVKMAFARCGRSLFSRRRSARSAR